MRKQDPSEPSRLPKLRRSAFTLSPKGLSVESYKHLELAAPVT